MDFLLGGMMEVEAGRSSSPSSLGKFADQQNCSREANSVRLRASSRRRPAASSHQQVAVVSHQELAPVAGKGQEKFAFLRIVSSASGRPCVPLGTEPHKGEGL